MIYLCNDILECIYLKIDNKRTQINMVKTSRYLYKKYYDDLVKMYIYRTLTNNDKSETNKFVHAKFLLHPPFLEQQQFAGNYMQ